MIGSEIMRAAVWQHKDKEKFLSALERGLELVDLCLDDPKWQAGLSMLFWLRDELARFYIGEANYEIETLYRAL